MDSLFDPGERDRFLARIASLREHHAYLQGLGEHPMADPEFLRAFAEMTGQRFRGEGAALAFEYYGS